MAEDMEEAFSEAGATEHLDEFGNPALIDPAAFEEEEDSGFSDPESEIV